MSNQFAMLTAARKLEKYLSREEYNLEKMSTNPNVPASLFETKASHYNGLVDTLNELFRTLADTDETLFMNYDITPETDVHPEEDFTYVSPEDNVTAEPAPQSEAIGAADAAREAEASEAETVPKWQLDGYASEQAWLADKDAESAEIKDDLSVGVNVSLSKYQAGRALSEYNETSEEDIASYDPDSHTPVAVLGDEASGAPAEAETAVPADDAPADNNPDLVGDDPKPEVFKDPEAQSEVEAEVAVHGAPDTEFSEPDSRTHEITDAAGRHYRPTENLDYMNHTVNNVRVDNDPTQILSVETAVERDGNNIEGGPTIDLDGMVYQSETPVVDNIIDADIEKLLNGEGFDGAVNDTTEPTEGDSDDVSGETAEVDDPADWTEDTAVAETLETDASDAFNGMADIGGTEYSDDDHPPDGA